MTSSYYDTNMNTATRAKAKDVQGHAKRMERMIEEMGAWAKMTLLPVFASLFLYVIDLLNNAKSQTKMDLYMATEAEKSSIMPVKSSLNSPSNTMQSPAPKILFRAEKSATATLLPVKPANLDGRLSKLDVKEARLGGHIMFRKGDMALKPLSNLAKPKEMELAERAARDEDGTIVFLNPEEKAKRNGKITFLRPDTPTANTNSAPAMILRRRREI